MPDEKRPKINTAAEPVNSPEQRLQSAGSGGEQSERPARPRPPVIDLPPQAVPAAGGGLIRILTAGVLGGLVGAGIVYLASPGGSAQDDEARQEIKALQSRAAELEASTAKAASAAPVNAASPEDLNGVRSQLTGLSKDEKGLDETVRSLAQRVQTVEQKPGMPKEAIQAEVSSEIAPIADRLAAIEHTQAETASQIAPIADRITGIEHTRDESQAGARTAAVTLALTNLKRAVAEGRPFAAELAAIETLSSAKLPVSELAPYKATGVQSLTELQRDFADASRKAIQMHYHGKADSVMGEVLSRAKAVIQVKPSGDAGDAVESVLGRMQTALKAGDLKTALTESASLEGPAKEQLQSWIEHAQARLTADEALQKTDQELIASLTKSAAHGQ